LRWSVGGGLVEAVVRGAAGVVAAAVAVVGHGNVDR
jgi:hypothetical protein